MTIIVKEKLRQQKLSFSKKDLEECKKGVMTVSLTKKIKQRLLLNLFLSLGLCAVYLCLELIIIYKNYNGYIDQTGSRIFYYSLLIGFLFLTSLSVWAIIINVKRLKKIETETLNSVIAKIEDIKYGVSSNRALIPYLMVKKMKFSPIIPLQTLSGVFEEKAKYKFYYSSNSKLLLAVEELS